MGGHNAGEFASRYTVETIVKTVSESEKKDAVSILEEAISSANSYLLEHARENEGMAGMGTTIVAATVKGSELSVANVGDSRLYIACLLYTSEPSAMRQIIWTDICMWKK